MNHLIQIQQLQTCPLIDGEGNCYGVKYPTDKEMFEKVNELITVVNLLLDAQIKVIN